MLKTINKAEFAVVGTFLYEILRSSFERKFDKTNFISLKRTPPKSPHRLGLTKIIREGNMSP